MPPFISEIARHGLIDGVVPKGRGRHLYPFIKKEMGRIDWTKSAEEIERQVRAFVLWPVSYTFLDGAMFEDNSLHR